MRKGFSLCTMKITILQGVKRMLKKLLCLICAMVMAVLPVLAEDADSGVT